MNANYSIGFIATPIVENISFDFSEADALLYQLRSLSPEDRETLRYVAVHGVEGIGDIDGFFDGLVNGIKKIGGAIVNGAKAVLNNPVVKTITDNIPIVNTVANVARTAVNGVSALIENKNNAGTDLVKKVADTAAQAVGINVDEVKQEIANEKARLEAQLAKEKEIAAEIEKQGAMTAKEIEQIRLAIEAKEEYNKQMIAEANRQAELVAEAQRALKDEQARLEYEMQLRFQQQAFELERMQSEYGNALTAANAEQAANLRTLEAQQRAELDATRDEYSKALSTANAEQVAKLKALEAQQRAELDATRDEYSKALSTANAEQVAKLKALEQQQSSALNATRSALDAAILDTRDTAADALDYLNQFGSKRDYAVIDMIDAYDKMPTSEGKYSPEYNWNRWSDFYPHDGVSGIGATDFIVPDSFKSTGKMPANIPTPIADYYSYLCDAYNVAPEDILSDDKLKKLKAKKAVKETINILSRYVRYREKFYASYKYYWHTKFSAADNREYGKFVRSGEYFCYRFETDMIPIAVAALDEVRKNFGVAGIGIAPLVLIPIVIAIVALAAASAIAAISWAIASMGRMETEQEFLDQIYKLVDLGELEKARSLAEEVRATLPTIADASVPSVFEPVGGSSNPVVAVANNAMHVALIGGAIFFGVKYLLPELQKAGGRHARA